MLTGLGSPSPAWSVLVLTQPEPTHPVLRGRSVVRLRDGMGLQALCDVMLHSRLCLPPPVCLTRSTLSVHCANPPFPPLTPSTGKVLDLSDPSSVTDSRDLLLLQCETYLPYCGTGLGQLFGFTRYKIQCQITFYLHRRVSMQIEPLKLLP